MATQYTPKLKLALPVQGELSGTWGDVVNDNITSMLEEAIAGLATINTWTANAHTLTVADGTTSEARAAILQLEDGAGLAGAGNVICPTSSKIYLLKNSTSYAITLKTSAGTGVAIPVGKTSLLYCDGTNVVEAIDSVTGTFNVGGAATFGSTVSGAFNGTLGATTPATVAATTLSTTGAATFGGEVSITGGTASGIAAGSSRIYGSPTLGNVMLGNGSSYDNTMLNRAGSVVFVNPANTLNVDFNGAATFGGNLGVGVTPSAWSGLTAIDVGATASNSSDSNGHWMSNNQYYEGAWKYKVSSKAAVDYYQQDGASVWRNAPIGTAGEVIPHTERMRLDASGNLLVGTTNANAKIYSYQTTAETAIRADNAQNSPTAVNYFSVFTGTSGATTSCNHFAGYADGANRVLIAGNGDVTNTNGAYGSISDIKLKENITDATPKLAGINAVRIVNYNLISDPEVKQLGVVAQELEQIFPGMVSETPDRDEDGNDLGTVTKSVKYSVFVPMLVKAMQEQQGIIDSLTARLDAAGL